MKTAIVTGGGSGIGKSCCLQLAESGIRVVAADINGAAAEETAAEITSAGGHALPFLVNMANIPGIRAMAAFAADMYGGPHILVNNAGLLHTTAIEDITEEEWDTICDVNLKGVFFACQAVLPYFKAINGGKIVNMSSLAGRNGGFANGMAYSASKAGVIGLTKGLAARLAQYNINVNAVCPGTTQTPILDGLTNEKLQKIMEIIPLGRLGKAEEIASLVCYLCSDQASFITGAVMDINGGMYI